MTTVIDQVSSKYKKVFSVSDACDVEGLKEVIMHVVSEQSFGHSMDRYESVKKHKGAVKAKSLASEPNIGICERSRLACR